MPSWRDYAEPLAILHRKRCRRNALARREAFRVAGLPPGHPVRGNAPQTLERSAHGRNPAGCCGCPEKRGNRGTRRDGRGRLARTRGAVRTAKKDAARAAINPSRAGRPWLTFCRVRYLPQIATYPGTSLDSLAWQLDARKRILATGACVIGSEIDSDREIGCKPVKGYLRGAGRNLFHKSTRDHWTTPTSGPILTP